MKFTTAQLNTTLAALRARQRLMDSGVPMDSDIEDIASDDGVAPLTTDEIDDLCEYLNCDVEIDDSPATNGEVFCSVCGDDHRPPECNDEFPEPGQIRETGR